MVVNNNKKNSDASLLLAVLILNSTYELPIKMKMWFIPVIRRLSTLEQFPLIIIKITTIAPPPAAATISRHLYASDVSGHAAYNGVSNNS